MPAIDEDWKVLKAGIEKRLNKKGVMNCLMKVMEKLRK